MMILVFAIVDDAPFELKTDLGPRLPWNLCMAGCPLHKVKGTTIPPLDVPNFKLKVLEFLLDLGILLRHLLILLFPLVPC